MKRTSPYGNYNFTVDLKSEGVDISSAFGGFSDVSGLGTELTVAEYRNGNDDEMHVRKIPGLHSTPDVTCKRGVLNSKDLWEWIENTRLQSVGQQRNVVITMNDEAGKAVQSWTLFNCIPLKYTGPTFAGKGGGDVAMEELVLSCEGIRLDGVGPTRN
ncbi:MAG: phage tail protein [Myxococcota bacterium]